MVSTLVAIKNDVRYGQQKMLWLGTSAPSVTAKTDFYLGAQDWLNVCLRPGAVLQVLLPKDGFRLIADGHI